MYFFQYISNSFSSKSQNFLEHETYMNNKLHKISESSQLTSKGSTSCEITTSCAFFCSTSLVTVLVPCRNTIGRLGGL